MSQKHIIPISVLGLLVLTALALWIFIGAKSHSFKAEAMAIETDLATKTTQDAYLGSVRNALRGSKAELAAIEGRFIGKDDIPEFINMLESRASSTGVLADFGSISVVPTESGSGMLKIHMTGSGSWSEVTSFIARLESLPYASKIESATFSNLDKRWSFGLDFIQHLSSKI